MCTFRVEGGEGNDCFDGGFILNTYTLSDLMFAQHHCTDRKVVQFWIYYKTGLDLANNNQRNVCACPHLLNLWSLWLYFSAKLSLDYNIPPEYLSYRICKRNPLWNVEQYVICVHVWVLQTVRFTCSMVGHTNAHIYIRHLAYLHYHTIA